MNFLDYYKNGMHEERLHKITYDSIKHQVTLIIALPMWKVEEIQENFNVTITGFELCFNDVKNFQSDINLDNLCDSEMTLKIKKSYKNKLKCEIFLFIENVFPTITFNGNLIEQKTLEVVFE